MLGVASTSGYQIVVNVGEAKQIKDTAVTSLQVSVFILIETTTFFKRSLFDRHVTIKTRDRIERRFDLSGISFKLKDND